MSKNKSITELLRELLFQVTTKKEKFLDATLQDGSTIRTTDDTIKTGSQVSLIGADGTATPVADGEYYLQDGSCLTVKSGVVEAIAPAPAPDAPATTADATQANPTVDAPAMAAQVDAPVDGVVAPQAADTTAPAGGDLATLVQIVKNLADRMQAIEDKVNNTKMAVEKMAAAPAADPINANKGAKMTVAEYLNNYRRDKIANEKKNLEQATKNFLKAKHDRGKETPQEFRAISNQGNTKKVVNNNDKKEFDFSFMGKSLKGISITNE